MAVKADSQDQVVSPDIRCEYFTPKDVAIRLNLSIDMVYALLREEHFPAIRLGTGRRQLWRIPIRDFEFFLATIRTGPLFDEYGQLIHSCGSEDDASNRNTNINETDKNAESVSFRNTNIIETDALEGDPD